MWLRLNYNTPYTLNPKYLIFRTFKKITLNSLISFIATVRFKFENYEILFSIRRDSNYRRMDP